MVPFRILVCLNSLSDDEPETLLMMQCR